MPEFNFISLLKGDVLLNVSVYLSQFVITVDQREVCDECTAGVLAAGLISKDASSSLSGPNVVKGLFILYGNRQHVLNRSGHWLLL